MKTWKASNTRKHSRTWNPLKNWRIYDESGELVATLADSTDEYSRAALIAQAPYMLAALEEILAEWETKDHPDTGGIVLARHAVMLAKHQ